MIALERANERVAAFIEEALDTGADVIIPASALAQVWRGGPRAARLAQLMVSTDGDDLDRDRAKQVGERLGRHARSDVADAHVVCCALEQGAILVTSDPDDMKSLATPGEPLVLVSA